MPTDHANDPTLGRMLSQLAYAVIWSGRVPEAAQPIWARQMGAPQGKIISARMAGYIGRAGSDLLRADAEGRPDEMRTTVSGIVTAAFLLKPSHVIDAMEDVLERLDVDVRDGICPDAACVPQLIEEDLNGLVVARSSADVFSKSSKEDPGPPRIMPAFLSPDDLPVGPRWDLYGLCGLERWLGVPESESSHSVRSQAAKPVFIHPSHTWSLDEIIALRLRWKYRRSMGLSITGTLSG